jgi:hypothetical protein
MSRRKSMVAREPNGRPQRARSPVEVKRLLDGAASGLKDQFWARRWGGCIFAAGSTEPSIEVRSGSNPVFLLGGRTSASAECGHWSGRAVRWSSCAILLRVRSVAVFQA